jgi:hypothetical protein
MDTPNVPSRSAQAAWYSLMIAGQIVLGIIIIVFVAKGPRIRNLSAILAVLLFAFFTAIVYSILLAIKLLGCSKYLIASLDSIPGHTWTWSSLWILVRPWRF